MQGLSLLVVACIALVAGTRVVACYVNKKVKMSLGNVGLWHEKMPLK